MRNCLFATAAAAALLIAATTNSAEARTGCVRDGHFTKCTYAKEVEPGKRRALKRLGADEGAPTFSIFVEYSPAEDCETNEDSCHRTDVCQLYVEIDEDGNGRPEWADYIISASRLGYLVSFSKGFGITSQNGELLLVDDNATLLEHGVSCWAAIKFRYAAEIEPLFK